MALKNSSHFTRRGFWYLATLIVLGLGIFYVGVPTNRTPQYYPKKVSAISIGTGTSVGGTINSNTVWTLANSPYTVTSNVTVDAHYTLTIEPGVLGPVFKS